MTETAPGRTPLPTVPGLTDLSLFARGGYATVYRATQVSVGREVAVKMENRTLDSERDQQRFLREARAAGRMSSHPHVVDLFDVGVTEDQHPYLIMELCDGSYAERMRNSPLGPAEARDLGVKIADALAHSHANGVLHRDVKPANILYSHFNTAVLADFGLAVLAEVRDPTVTLEVLTPAYAPPEMFRQAEPAPAVDVYALCATLYAVMSGRPPRWRNERDPSLVMLMEMFQQPVPDLPGVPGPLLDVLRRGMANDPAERPSAEHLRDLLADVPLDSRHGSPAGPVPRQARAGSGSAAGGFAGADGSTAGPGGVSGGSAGVSGAWAAGPGGGSHDSAAGPSGGGAGGGAAGPGGGSVRAGATAGGGDTVAAAPARLFPWPRWRVALGIVAAVALLVLVAALSWYVGRHPGGAAAPSAPATGSAPAGQYPPTAGSSSSIAGSSASAGGPSSAAGPSRPAGRPSSGAAAGLPGCRSGLPAGARCPTSTECFGPVRIRGTAAEAQPVACAGRHTWETYALGELPADVDPRDEDAVRAAAGGRVCTTATFARVTGLASAGGWRFEVLPPDRTAAAAGDRSYRCLAGRGVDGLVGPSLGR
ncbi:serine/threonine-protein kinase [Plantactinospora siamensis]|uniref:non-specific serine/threonine protein kinase n=1 Tax=Plantactinospora siamensis TaxID=555372 RepID=A0ABV6P539_9ACTN